MLEQCTDKNLTVEMSPSGWNTYNSNEGWVLYTRNKTKCTKQITFVGIERILPRR